ncbi:S41 family peptidase [Bacillus marasmi]|uniref:lmo1851 family serine protease n=1 Tax=Bacillus marasmi TaxID=1926279 RepID=UPI0011C7F20C
MKVVRGLEQKELDQQKLEPNQHEQQQEQQQKSEHPAGFIRMKKFHFAMLLLILVFLTAGITTFALAFGDEKVVSPVMNERQEFDKLYSVFDTIKRDYFKDVKDSKLINGAIDGMMNALDDPYSDYMDIDETNKFHKSISSTFEGIGAEISEQDGHIVIVTPIKGSPAEKAGLKPNDKVITVDGKSLQGMNTTEAVSLIRGEKGTKVELAILRPGVDEPFNVSIIRDTIPLQTVYGEMVEGEAGIAKVHISSFSTNTTEELTQVLQDLKGQGMKGLILDLRQNPGGLLDQAINISSMFVPKGKPIFKVENRKGEIEEYKSNNQGDASTTPLVVLIDKGSASASEIFAAAVSESAGVPLIGQTSFGKGTVQRAQDLPDGSNIKFTTEKWLTPKGNWIHKKGVKPNYEVALPEHASLQFLDPEKEWKLSSASSDVKNAQKMLKAIGYDPGREDGYFDEKTEAAIQALQKDAGLETNGVLTGATSMTLMTRLSDTIKNNDPQVQKAIEILKTKM